MTKATAEFLLSLLNGLTIQIGPDFKDQAAQIVAAQAELAAVLNEE